jgi:hypothetical protein
MEVSSMKRIVLFVLLLFVGMTLVPLLHGKTAPGRKILTYAGRYFQNLSSPGYASYDREMGMHVAQRIKEQYDVALDHTAYSAFDLLEIEALLKCKKSEESADSLLKRFQK